MSRLSLVLVCGFASLAFAEPAPAPPPAPPAPATTGVVKGQIRFAGKAPARATIQITKDANVCGKPPLKEEFVIVNPKGGGLENAIVWIEGARGEARPGRATVDQRNCRFAPRVLAVTVGSEVVFVNSDATMHNVHGWLGDDTTFNIALPMKGLKSKQKIEVAGRMLLKCDAGHTWMQAWVMGFAHPFFAVTDKNGAFRIAGLPPGKYPVKVWHEKLGELSGEVTINAGAEATVALAYKGK